MPALEFAWSLASAGDPFDPDIRKGFSLQREATVRSEPLAAASEASAVDLAFALVLPRILTAKVKSKNRTRNL
jgi:hypothetical protein